MRHSVKVNEAHGKSKEMSVACMTQVNVKIFVAAYMIVEHASHVLTEKGDLENALFDASKAMILAFEKTADALSKGVLWHRLQEETTDKLPKLLCNYLRAFKAWKLVDEVKVIARVKSAIQGLDNAEDIMEDKIKNFDVITSLKAQQQRLRQQMVNLKGQKELDAYDADRREAASKRRKCSSNTGVDNSQLAHELLLDPDFRLEEDSGKSNDKLVRTKLVKPFPKDFWKLLCTHLTTNPPSYSRVLLVLTKIKASIESLSAGHSEGPRIAAIISDQVTTKLLSGDTLDYRECKNIGDAIVDVLVSMHNRMKSAERRRETVDGWNAVCEVMTSISEENNLAHAHAMTVALEFVVDRVHALQVDTTNNKLKGIAAVVRNLGVAYERSYFDSQSFDFKHTQAWISYTVQNLASSPIANVSVSDLMQGDPDAYEVVVNIAIINLVVNHPTCVQEHEMPETMLKDALHIKVFHEHFHTHVVSALILVTVEQNVREVIHDLPARDRIIREVQDTVLKNLPNPTAPLHTIKLVIEKLSANIPFDKLTAMQNMLEKNVGDKSIVYVPMINIFKETWLHLIDGKGKPKPCKVPPCAQLLIPLIQKHVLILKKMAELSKKVHVTKYNEMIKKAAADCMPPPT